MNFISIEYGDGYVRGKMLYTRVLAGEDKGIEPNAKVKLR